MKRQYLHTIDPTASSADVDGLFRTSHTLMNDDDVTIEVDYEDTYPSPEAFTETPPPIRSISNSSNDRSRSPFSRHRSESSASSSLNIPADGFKWKSRRDSYMLNGPKNTTSRHSHRKHEKNVYLGSLYTDSYSNYRINSEGLYSEGEISGDEKASWKVCNNTNSNLSKHGYDNVKRACRKGSLCEISIQSGRKLQNRSFAKQRTLLSSSTCPIAHDSFDTDRNSSHPNNCSNKRRRSPVISNRALDYRIDSNKNRTSDFSAKESKKESIKQQNPNGKILEKSKNCELLQRRLTKENLELHNRLYNTAQPNYWMINNQKQYEILSVFKELPKKYPESQSKCPPKDREGAAWIHLGKLQTLKKCHHCQKHRWQSSSRPICKECQHLIERKFCYYCRQEILQHRILKYAEKHFKKPICLQCARHIRDCEETNDLPRVCKLCQHEAIWNQGHYCDRCSDHITKYGKPEQCNHCYKTAAFRRGMEKLKKVDGLLLCFDCTFNYKLKKRLLQKKLHQQYKSDDIDNLGRLAPYKKELKELKALAITYKTESTGCEKQLKTKTSKAMKLIKKVEDRNIAVEQELQEWRHLSSLNSQRVSEYLQRLTNLNLKKNNDIQISKETHSGEYEEFNSLITMLQCEKHKLEKELNRKQRELVEVRTAIKQKQRALERYKSITEKRIKRLNENYLKVIAEYEKRANNENMVIARIRGEIRELTHYQSFNQNEKKVETMNN